MATTTTKPAEKTSKTKVLHELVDETTKLQKAIQQNSEEINAIKTWIQTTLKPTLSSMKTEVLGEIDGFKTTLAKHQDVYKQSNEEVISFRSTLESQKLSINEFQNRMEVKFLTEIEKIEKLVDGKIEKETKLLSQMVENHKVKENPTDKIVEEHYDLLEARLEQYIFKEINRQAREAQQDSQLLEERLEQVLFREILRLKTQLIQHKEDQEELESSDFSAKQQEVLQWLTENGLEVYFPHFIEKGYDTMAVVKHLILEDLDHLKVTLPGHRKALLLAVHSLNPSGPTIIQTTKPETPKFNLYQNNGDLSSSATYSSVFDYSSNLRVDSNSSVGSTFTTTPNTTTTTTTTNSDSKSRSDSATKPPVPKKPASQNHDTDHTTTLPSTFTLDFSEKVEENKDVQREKEREIEEKEREREREREKERERKEKEREREKESERERERERIREQEKKKKQLEKEKEKLKEKESELSEDHWESEDEESLVSTAVRNRTSSNANKPGVPIKPSAIKKLTNPTKPIAEKENQGGHDFTDPKVVCKLISKEDPEVSWALWKWQDEKVKVLAHGKGDTDELMGFVDDHSVLYGYLRTHMGAEQRTKFVLIEWIGELITPKEKAKGVQFKTIVLESYAPFFHVELRANHRDDVTSAIVAERLKNAAGANYDRSQNEQINSR